MEIILTAQVVGSKLLYRRRFIFKYELFWKVVMILNNNNNNEFSTPRVRVKTYIIIYLYTMESADAKIEQYYIMTFLTLIASCARILYSTAYSDDIVR